MKELLTIEMLARQLHLPVDAVRAAVRSGALSAIRMTPKTIRFDPDLIGRYREEIGLLDSGPETGVYVYVIGRADSERPIKIGMGHPVARLRKLQTGSAERLEVRLVRLFASRSLARRVERDLHRIFQQARLSGEWFDTTVEAVQEKIALLAIRYG